jgi:serine/threonine-protein kinase
LVFNELSETSLDVHVLLLEGQRASQPLLQTQFSEGSPAISPDGRWVAYRSTDTGRFEIYVRPFPDADKGKWQISTEGGVAPVWSPDGRQLFFQNGDAMIVAAVHATVSFAAGTPKVLFKGKYVPGPGGSRNFDISPDGRRFIMIKDVEHTLEASARDELTVVLNWFDELRQLVPAKK